MEFPVSSAASRRACALQAWEAAHDEDFSVTGVMAGLAVFALGAVAVGGDYTAAAGAAAAALAALLASREVLHGMLKRLIWIDALRTDAGRHDSNGAAAASQPHRRSLGWTQPRRKSGSSPF
jgi:hypothetical protein